MFSIPPMIYHDTNVCISQCVPGLEGTVPTLRYDKLTLCAILTSTSSLELNQAAHALPPSALGSADEDEFSRGSNMFEYRADGMTCMSTIMDSWCALACLAFHVAKCNIACWVKQHSTLRCCNVTKNLHSACKLLTGPASDTCSRQVCSKWDVRLTGTACDHEALC